MATSICRDIVKDYRLFICELQCLNIAFGGYFIWTMWMKANEYVCVYVCMLRTKPI